MKKFNPDRELYKIKYGKRDKIILGIFLLLVIVSIGSTFALYQVRHSKRIIYTTVDDFTKDRDIILSVHLGDKEDNKFPVKGTGYYYDKIVCDNSDPNYTEANWDSYNWLLDVKTKGPNKCDVYFKYVDEYRDKSGANPPELYQGLIPVYFDEAGKVRVADLHSGWYDYDAHEWANAVLVNTSDANIKQKYFKEDKSLNTEMSGKEIPMEEITQMYVWIPRYKYKLFNVDNGKTPPQMIEVEFETNTQNTGDITCTYQNMGNGSIVETCKDKEDQKVQNGDWYTHPGFTFGDSQLKGLWISKFQVSGSKDNLNALPNKITLGNMNLYEAFTTSQNVEQNYELSEDEIDTHVLRNMEWGAVTYLSQSKYGIFNVSENNITCAIDSSMNEQTCRIYQNNTGIAEAAQSITGCSGSYINELIISTTCKSGYQWNEGGAKASTTGKIYGVYDMSGAVWEYVMTLMLNTNNTINYSSTGFNVNNLPKSKYYDIYSYTTSGYDYSISHLGDGVREMISGGTSNLNNGWNSGWAVMPETGAPIFVRGGRHRNQGNSIFAFSSETGTESVVIGYHLVLTAQDGNE